jgi:MOSC domain-containing protein YiiM
MPTEPRGHVELVNVGHAAELAVGKRTMRSGIGKRPQPGAVAVSAAGLDGDEVADRIHHGGPNRALHVFATEHYDVFSARLDEPVPRPWVGENLTLRGYPDDTARIGDTLRIGTALMQVTMPTERCGHPGALTGIQNLRQWMIDDLRSGFYLRVLEIGRVGPGDSVEVVERGDPQWTVSALSAVMYRTIDDPGRLALVEQIPLLAPEYKERLRILHARAVNRP